MTSANILSSHESEHAVLLFESTTGTRDDRDDPGDERADENEIPVRETEDSTEAPEEFEVDDEEELGQTEDEDDEDDDDADLDDDDEDFDDEDDEDAGGEDNNDPVDKT